MKYLIGVIAVVFLVVLSIVYVVMRGPSTGEKKSGDAVTKLVDDAREGAVSYTIQGPVVNEQERRSVRIQVDKNLVRVEILKGYNEMLENSQTFPNNSAAYETFLASLDVAGFVNKRDADPEDHKGACPLGRTYLYELQQGNQTTTQLWSTTCSTRQGTFAGKATTIQQLFQKQVPQYDQFTSSVRL